MDPVTISSMFPGMATAGGHGVAASAQTTGPWTHGGLSNFSDLSGSHQFSLSKGMDGSLNFNMGGEHLSGLTDMVSGPFTKSFSFFQPGSGTAGHLIVDQLTGNITTTGLGTKLGTSLATAMKSAGLI